MKRLIVVFLVFVLLLSFGVNTFAKETDKTVGANETVEISVLAKGNFKTKTPDVYGVDISWTDMVFVYSVEETKNWNTQNHNYEVESKTEWEKAFAEVKITNHSNVPVSVKIEYLSNENSGFLGTLSNPSEILEAGKEGDFYGADYMICTLNISGESKSTNSSGGEKIGTLKIIVE